MPILDQVNWRPKFTMTDIIRRIDALIHQEINPYSPANASLFDLYLKKNVEYK
jgi:ubiquitin-protein ligase